MSVNFSEWPLSGNSLQDPQECELEHMNQFLTNIVTMVLGAMLLLFLWIIFFLLIARI